MHDNRRAEPAMIGRTLELERLKSVFTGVSRARQLEAVTIVGEGGIGKSRLLREFQNWLEGEQRQALVCARASAEMTGRPFSLLRALVCARFCIYDSDAAQAAQEKLVRGLAELVPRSASALDMDAPRLAQFIGRTLGFDFPAEAQAPVFDTTQEDRRQLLKRLGDFFVLICKTASAPRSSASAVLVLEDIHWADEDSLDVLAGLFQQNVNAPLMIVCLTRPTLLERRPEWAQGTGHDRIELEPLSDSESASLAESLQPRLEPRIRRIIVARTAGNPLYIDESLKMVVENHRSQSGRGASLEGALLTASLLAPTLSGVISERLDALSPTERAILDAASVVGHVFWDSAILRLMGWQEAGAANAGGGSSSQEIADGLGGLCFKKLIYRRDFSGFAATTEFAFQHELLREATYQRVANQIRRSHHERVAAWLVQQSGDRIAEFTGLVAIHLEQAGLTAEAAEWHGRSGQQARVAYAHAAAVDSFRKALSLISNQPQTADSSAKQLAWHEGLAVCLTKSGRFAEAERVLEQWRTIAERTADLPAQCRAWNGLAHIHERRGENRASIEAASKAEVLARQAGGQSGGDLVQALFLKGWALYRLGDAREVLVVAAQTLDLCRTLGDRGQMVASSKLFGVAYLQLGRYAESEKYFRDGLTICQETGDRRNCGVLLSNLGESARLRGDYQAAVDLYSRALEIAREMDEKSSAMIYLSNLGGARLGLGQFREAEAELRQAIAGTGMSKSCTLSETHAFLAKALLGQGRFTEALAAAQSAVAIGAESEIALDSAGGWRALGEVAAAMEQARLPRPITAPHDPATCFAASLQIYQQISADHEQARTLSCWSEFDRQSGRLVESQQRAQFAQEILRRLSVVAVTPENDA